MKLADRNFEHFIYPITLLKEVEKILLVRDKKGPRMNKVDYYCPPSWSLRFPIVALFFKFLLMTYLSRREKPALIHAYLLSPHGYLAFLTGKLTRRKVGVSLIAGPMELYVLGGSPVEKYAYTKPLPKLPLHGKIIQKIVKSFDIITTTGSFTKFFLVNHDIKEHKIFVLPHVVDKRFKSMNIQKEYDIVYIGRLAQVKHVETLIKAVSVVKEDNPHIRAAILGEGPEKDKLERLSKRLDLVNNIDFVGYQSDAWNWYTKAKISVLTSEREGFPYSVIESLSCGVPVITSNCGDVCDVIKDCYNGVIIEDYHDYQSFAEAIIDVLQNPQIITEYSNNALKTAENLTVEKAVLVWKGIFHKITDEEYKI
jgi:glycosyltransferase involved in cell wall biosynthesis